ncbi:protein phosphatase 2C domain-containing protein [Luteococcus sp. Sow4_B9]|uniref:protein phosphatase 2C domain-containing protein n=1 Tax=Luteococcus sp. Sow4_B9 TaxID=3438792 RepID=UPI003F980FBF
MCEPQVFTRPASCDRDNEDAAATAPGIGVVTDGAGLPKSMRQGCHHEVSWYSTHLAQTYRDQLARRDDTMAGSLATAIRRVAELHPECDLAAGSPSATLAAWRVTGSVLETLVLCDASILVALTNGQVTELTDDRLGELATRAAASATCPDGIRAAQAQVLEEQRNQSGGWWCCHHDPSAAAEARVENFPLGSVRGVIGASDGATRFHQSLGGSLTRLTETVLRGDAERIHQQVREWETKRASALQNRARKVHDDFTLAWQLFDRA